MSRSWRWCWLGCQLQPPEGREGGRRLQGSLILLLPSPSSLSFHPPRLYLHSFLGMLVECLSLALKDACIGFEQVFSLHALPARHGSHQDGNINILEADCWVSCRNNICVCVCVGRGEGGYEVEGGVWL